MKKDFLFCCLAAMLALAITRPLTKSGWFTGSLKGEVTDPSGAVVPGATIVISSDQETETLSTDAAGEYAVTGLTPGAYDVTVSSEGFAPFDKAGVVVSAGGRIEMDAILHLAPLKQAITVTAGDRTVMPGGAGQ